MTVGAEPQVRLLHVSEQEELADPPERRHPHHVVDPLVFDVDVGGPGFVVPVQDELLGAVVADPDPAG